MPPSGDVRPLFVGEVRPRPSGGAFQGEGKPIRMFLAALGAVFVVVGPASAMSHREYVAYKHCEQGIVRSCIHRAAIHRHVDFGSMLFIAHRESRFDPLAKNPSSTASGLFQFLTSTWAHTPYWNRPIFSAKWNSLAAGWAMSRGYWSWWACC